MNHLPLGLLLELCLELDLELDLGLVERRCRAQGEIITGATTGTGEGKADRQWLQLHL